MQKDIILRFRLLAETNGQAYLGEGRIALLEQISKYGSIAKGAEAINMSYRKAWQLIKDMNNRALSPLVEKKPGGNKGGGTILTEEGMRVIGIFRKLQNEIDDFLSVKLNELNI